MFKRYYTLTKPGIIYGNALTATAGFLLASKLHIYGRLFIATILGTCLVIASACVVNNYIDRTIDKHMARTKKRALVIGTISKQAALIFATGLGVAGFLLLTLYTHLLVVIIGLIAFVDYVVLYGLAKRRSVHGTIVGSIAGAAPIVAGYCAVINRFDSGAIILFLILTLWQMPHFYAIAIYRLKDYAAASLPVLPVKKGITAAKMQIVLYVGAFIIATSLPTIFGYTGYVYLVIMLLVGSRWLWLGLQGYKTRNSEAWARKMFFFSLLIILSLSIMLPLGSRLP